MLKRIFALLLTPVLLFAVSFYAWFFCLNPAQHEIIKRNFLSKVPFVKQFITVQQDTGLFNVEYADVAELKTEAYYVDYLVNISQKNGQNTERFICVYPYMVEAVTDISRPEISTAGEKNIVRYPAPELRVGSDTDREPLIVRDSVSAERWSDTLKPVKAALHEKALVDAVHSGILEKAEERSQKQLEKWAAPAAAVEVQHNDCALHRLAPPHLGIAFYAYQNTSTALRLEPITGYKYDAELYEGVNSIGCIKFKGKEFTSKFKDIEDNKSIIFNFYDTNAPDHKKTRIIFKEEDSTLDGEILSDGKVYVYTNEFLSSSVGNASNSEMKNESIKTRLISSVLNTRIEANTLEKDYVEYRVNTIKAAEAFAKDHIAEARSYIDAARRYDSTSFTSKLLDEYYGFVTEDKPITVQEELADLSKFYLAFQTPANAYYMTDELVAHLRREAAPWLNEAIDYLLSCDDSGMFSDAQKSVSEARQRSMQGREWTSCTAFSGSEGNERANYLRDKTLEFNKGVNDGKQRLYVYGDGALNYPPYLFFNDAAWKCFVRGKAFLLQDLLDKLSQQSSVYCNFFVLYTEEVFLLPDNHFAFAFAPNGFYFIKLNTKLEKTKCSYIPYEEINIAGGKLHADGWNINNDTLFKLMSYLQKIFSQSSLRNEYLNEIKGDIRDNIGWFCK